MYLKGTPFYVIQDQCFLWISWIYNTACFSPKKQHYWRESSSMWDYIKNQPALFMHSNLLWQLPWIIYKECSILLVFKFSIQSMYISSMVRFQIWWFNCWWLYLYTVTWYQVTVEYTVVTFDKMHYKLTYTIKKSVKLCYKQITKLF